jgi:hypothetical protein
MKSLYSIAIIPLALFMVSVSDLHFPGARPEVALPAKALSTNGGWQKLFDGKTTRGWHTYGMTTVGDVWKAQDSSLFLDASVTTGRGDIVTDSEYENFDLKLEWKISKGANSGIMFLVHEDTTLYSDTYDTGPEMQILDNEGHPDGKIFKHRAGDLYDLVPCRQQTVRAIGEWNQAEIQLKSGHLKLYLNGMEVVDTKMWDPEWDKMVAGSKFATMHGFATFHKGHISLQDHGGNESVWFRNIEIKRL